MKKQYLSPDVETVEIHLEGCVLDKHSNDADGDAFDKVADKDNPFSGGW